MTKKGSLLLSGTVTAFVLVLVGGIAGRAAGPPSATTADAVPGTTDWQAREAEYKRLIHEANRRLAEAATPPEPKTVEVSEPGVSPVVYEFEPEHHDNEHRRRKHREHEDDEGEDD